MAARSPLSAPVGLAGGVRRPPAARGQAVSAPARAVAAGGEQRDDVRALRAVRAARRSAPPAFSPTTFLLRPDLDEIAGGQTRWAVSIANSREQAGLLLNYVKTHRRASARCFARSLCPPATTGSCSKATGSRRRSLPGPADPRHLASALVFDEASHFVSESLGAENAGPGLAGRATAVDDLRGAGADVRDLDACATATTSTDRLFVQAEQGALPGAVAFRASTQELNPAVSDCVPGRRRRSAPRRERVPARIPGRVHRRRRRRVPGGGRRRGGDRPLPRASPRPRARAG